MTPRMGRLAAILLVLGAPILILGIFLTQQGAPDSPDPLHREVIERRFDDLGYPIVFLGAFLVLIGVWLATVCYRGKPD